MLGITRNSSSSVASIRFFLLKQHQQQQNPNNSFIINLSFRTSQFIINRNINTKRLLTSSNNPEVISPRLTSYKNPLKKPIIFLTGLVLGTLGYFYLIDSRAAIYKHVVMPLSHALLDPETSHQLAIQLAKYGICPKEIKDSAVDSKGENLLQVKLWGKVISNPLGLAAGFDKHADAIDSLLKFGFGLVEIGSVTPLPQDGNAKPRMFRLMQDSAVINRYGFNSEGHASVEEKLKARIANFNFGLRRSDEIPSNINRSLTDGRLLGVNLGKNKISPAESNQDYVQGIQTLGKYADYLVVNVSSPNTPGLRSLQRREAMESLLNEVKNARDTYCTHCPPLVVKIAPDLTETEVQDISQVIQKVGIDGVIISNTTISRPETLKSELKYKREYGGLSGPPVKPLALQVVRQIYKETEGKIPIIGCGGVQNAQDVLDFAKAGATLVQLYTSLGYQGPSLIPEIKQDLVTLLEKEGKKWTDIIGSEHK